MFVTNIDNCFYPCTENSLIECGKGLRNDLQYASEDISSLFTKLGMMNSQLPLNI